MMLQTGHDELLCHCGEDDQLNLMSKLYYKEAILSTKSTIIHS
jgi:hypothetical protein